MHRVLIANRGEIALRIAKACAKLGLESVAVYSDADADASYLRTATHAVRLGPPRPERSYLSPELLLHVASATGCDAVHPGYGFLAENAEFAARCAAAGFAFVGPTAETIALMGDKTAARRTAICARVPVVPGSKQAFDRLDEARAAAADIGYPILLKARAGGGGRGMRIVADETELETQFTQARSEAAGAFGDGALYLERYLPRVRHIEVQIFGDMHGNVRHVWERDCTIQRRHQKLVEEAPAPALDQQTRIQLCEAAERLAREVDYRNAGTVEFILDPETSDFYFIEMNTRIQVEHPVTEEITGLDLVLEQLRVAAGEPLSFADRPPRITGHAIEFRINAEDPDKDFRPCPGRIRRWRRPTGPGIRLDTHLGCGDSVPPCYDSLMAKLIVSGCDRAEALNRAIEALGSFEISGPASTVPFHMWLLQHPDFWGSKVHTRWVEERMACGCRHE